MNTRQLQLVILLTVLVSSFSPSVIFAKNVELLPEPIGIKVQPQCVTGGCSGEICTDASAGPIYSTCQWKAEYACLPKAKCEVQSSGKCGWTYTEEYNQCMYGDPIQPVISPEPKNTCGNNICEAGESDVIEGGCQTGTPDSCLGPPLKIIKGSCPADCPVPTDKPNPIATPVTPTVTTKPTVTVTPTTRPLPTLPEEAKQSGPEGSYDNATTPSSPIAKEILTLLAQSHSRKAEVTKLESQTRPSVSTLYDRVISHIRSLLPHYWDN